MTAEEATGIAEDLAILSPDVPWPSVNYDTMLVWDTVTDQEVGWLMMRKEVVDGLGPEQLPGYVLLCQWTRWKWKNERMSKSFAEVCRESLADEAEGTVKDSFSESLNSDQLDAILLLQNDTLCVRRKNKNDVDIDIESRSEKAKVGKLAELDDGWTLSETIHYRDGLAMEGSVVAISDEEIGRNCSLDKQKVGKKKKVKNSSQAIRTSGNVNDKKTFMLTECIEGKEELDLKSKENHVNDTHLFNDSENMVPRSIFDIEDEDISADHLLSILRKHACPSCKFRARKFETLKVHIEMNHVKLRFFCKFCTFESKEKYPTKGHLKQKHGVSLEDSDMHIMFECGICRIKGSKGSFETHIADMHDSLRIILQKGEYNLKKGEYNLKNCELCQKDFTGTLAASAMCRSHVEAIHMKNSFECGKCGFGSKRKQAVYDHIGEKHVVLGFDKHKIKGFKRSNTKYKCSICNFLAENHHEMLDHMKEEHEEYLRKAKGQRSGRNEIKICEFCQKDFTGQKFAATMFRSHLEVVHMQNGFECASCRFESSYKQTLYEHIGKKHVALGLNTDEIKEMKRNNTKYKCKHCIYLAESHHEMLRHIKEDHEEDLSRVGKARGSRRNKLKFCEYCKKDFTDTKFASAMFRRHLEVVHMQNSFECAKCGFESSLKQTVYEHIGDDHVESRLKEEINGFKRNNTKYKCRICFFPADSHHKMFRHMKEEHEEDLRVVKKVQRRSRKVLRNVDDCDLKYKCPHCDYETKFHQNMKKHFEIHMNSSFSCTICGVSRKRRCLVLNHIKREHPEREELNSMGLWVQLVSCFCKDCNLVGTRSTYDDHLEVNHKFPKVRGKKRPKKHLDRCL